MKYTSEAVGKGHPDKICDYLSDTILSIALKEDQNSKVAIETFIKGNQIHLFGELSSNANLDYEEIIKTAMKELAYDESFTIKTNISKQSSQIAGAVLKDEIMAGDQGIFFGYATNETKSYLPLSFELAQKIIIGLDKLAQTNQLIKTDTKAQVTIEDGQVDTIVVAVLHDESLAVEELRKIVKEKVIDQVIDPALLKQDLKIKINAAGAFTLGGPWADAGLTGRKIVCDSYGGEPVGGGAFSGKDPSKVDRSAAYYARYVAKNIVMHGLADQVLVQLAYVIGESEPVSLYIDCKNTEKVTLEEIKSWVLDNFNFKVQNIIEELNLLEIDYRQTTNYGHFGRGDFPWERKKIVK